MEKEIFVIKESGEKERFDIVKARKAVKRSGLSEKDTDGIIKKFLPRLYNGITTRKIYALLFELIEEKRPEASSRFNLKRALMELGPAGYNFEDFMGKLLELYGYRVVVRQIIDGKCVRHEIDLIAEKGNERYMCECKFHNAGGVKCRIQEALYTYARFLDLCNSQAAEKDKRFTRPWLISNTKFSEDVQQYAECMGFPLLGWRYPFDNGLERMIESKKCYPITVIKTNSKNHQKLLASRIITIFDVPENVDKLASVSGLHINTAQKIIETANQIR